MLTKTNLSYMLTLTRRGESAATIITNDEWELVEDTARQTRVPRHDGDLGVVIVNAWLERGPGICQGKERILRMERNKGPDDELEEKATFWCKPTRPAPHPTLPAYLLGTEVYASLSSQ